MNKLSIATLNVWNKNFEWNKRLPLILSELRRINPDIIALQEVLKDKSSNTSDLISEGLGGYTSFFYPEVEGSEKSSGVAILCKMTPIKSYLFRFSRYFNDPNDTGNKLFGCLEFEIGGLRKLFVGTTWLSISEQAQERAVRELGFFVKDQLSLKENDILVIAGDMNNVTDKPIVELKRLGINGMVDTFEEFNGGQNPDTWPNSKDFFIKSWKDKHPDQEMDFEIVKRRVDYLLVSKVANVKITSSMLFADKADSEGMYPSDHLGICSEISID